MILVDTSVWVDHFRASCTQLTDLLVTDQVLAHPWVTGELALGSLKNRAEVLRLLGDMPQAVVATDTEVLSLIERSNLYGLGIGYVDTQLLAATRLTIGATLWTRDKRLAVAAERLGVAARI